MGSTPGAGNQRATGARHVALALLAVLAVLALAVPATSVSRQLMLERRSTSDEVVAAAVAAGLTSELGRVVEDLGSGAAGPPGEGGGPGALPPGVVVDGFLPAQVDDGPTAGPPTARLLTADDISRGPHAALLARARDTGTVQVGPPVDRGPEGPRLVAVAPRYSTGEQPRTIALRRDRLEGWEVAGIHPGGLASPHLEPGAVAVVLEGGLAFPVGAGDPPPPAVARDAHGVPDRLAEVTVDSHGHRFVVRAGVPTPVPVAARTVLFALGGALGATAAAAAVLLVARRVRAERALADRAGRQVDLIGEVAPLVQQSLDLSDVLPSVAVQLMDHFDLRGIRLASATGPGGRVELFGVGAAPAERVEPVVVPPDHVEAGSTLALALQRGGRSVATLHLLAGRDLDDADLRSLRALVELVTAAVVNAALYSSQQETLRQLRDLDALKTVFLSTASHELRTPATTIGGFASLLDGSWDQLDEEKRRTFASRIAANARSLGTVVQDLLDFSLLDRGRLSLVIEPLALGPLVEEVVSRLAPELAEHQVVVRVGDAPLVAGAHNAIERIVTNLLTNAAKYSPAGTTVTIEVAAHGDGARLVVSDQGPGVPHDEREQVFARFYRGTGEQVVQTRGVGIGLSVVAELVERMGGDVRLDDAAGGGARFTVWLPRAVTDTAAHTEEGHDASTA